MASLDWRVPQAFLDAEERAPDLILGADLVYERRSPRLATTLDALLCVREARAEPGRAPSSPVCQHGHWALARSTPADRSSPRQPCRLLRLP